MPKHHGGYPHLPPRAGVALLVAGIVMLAILGSCTELGSWDQLTADIAALDWGYRIPLTIDNSGVAAPASGVVCLVRLTPDRFPYDKLASNGEDIGFFSDQGDELPFELELWQPGGESRFWVRVPQVPAAGTPARFWLYFGSRGKRGRNDSDATWDESFAAVWHLSPREAGTGSYRDSSGNGNHLANGFGNNTPFGSVEGVLGTAAGAVGRERETDALVAAANRTLDNLGPLTYEFWFRDVGAPEGAGVRLLSKGPIFLWVNSNSFRRLALTVSYGDNGEQTGSNLFKEATLDWPQDTWTHVAVTWDGGPEEEGVLFYREGADAGSTNRSDAAGTRDDDSPTAQFVGNSAGSGTSQAPGAHLDEIRISTVVRSPGWLLLSYRSARDQLVSFGPVESL